MSDPTHEGDVPTARRTTRATASATPRGSGRSAGVVVPRAALLALGLVAAVELAALVAVVLGLVARRRPSCEVQVTNGQCAARCAP